MNETARKVAGQAWAQGETRALAQRICEGREPVDSFERQTFLNHCQQLATREGVSLASVVLDYASDRRF